MYIEIYNYKKKNILRQAQYDIKSIKPYKYK